MELPRGLTYKIEQPSIKVLKKLRGRQPTFQSPKPDYQLLISFNPKIKMDQLERFWILSAIEKCNGSIYGAARMLGMAKETVYRKVRKYNETR